MGPKDRESRQKAKAFVNRLRTEMFKNVAYDNRSNILEVFFDIARSGISMKMKLPPRYKEDYEIMMKNFIVHMEMWTE